MTDKIDPRENADPRAYKFYSYYFTGEEHRWMWDTCAEELEPTKIIDVGYRNLCWYCGGPAKPIQRHYSFHPMVGSTYRDAGYTCDCKGAMDELDFNARVTVLKEEHKQQMGRLMKEAPKQDPEVFAKIKAFAQNVLDNIKEPHGLDKLVNIKAG